MESLVLATNWCVSYTTGTDIVGCILHVYRFSYPCHCIKHPIWYGVNFPNVETAQLKMLEHGFLQKWESGIGWRKRHGFVGFLRNYTPNVAPPPHNVS